MEIQPRGQGEKTVAFPARPSACEAVHWLACAVLCCAVCHFPHPLHHWATTAEEIGQDMLL